MPRYPSDHARARASDSARMPPSEVAVDLTQTPGFGAPRNLLSQAATFASGHTIALPGTWLTPLRVSFIGVGALEGIWSSRTFTVADLVGSATGTAEVGTVSAAEFSGSGILDVETSDGYREFPIFLGLSTLAADGAVATLASLAGDSLGSSATDVSAAAAFLGTGEGSTLLAAVANAAIVGDSALSGLAGVALMAGLSGAGAGSAAIETPPSGMSFSHTFSGSTKPTGFTEYGGGYTVSGGVATGAASSSGMVYGTDASTNNQYCEVTVTLSSPLSQWNLLLRSDSTAENCVVATVMLSALSASYNQVAFSKITGGSSTTISTVPMGVSHANGAHTIRFEYSGNTLTVKVDGVTRGTATQSGVTGSRIGVRFSDTSAASGIKSISLGDL